MKGSPEFRSRDLAIKTRIGRENTNSRRFSASSIREDTNSFRSNITISSSTVSSPGYTAREEIDPSTYSFTTALKALQAKARLVDNWEIKGVALNSKWNEAEKYISNPLSGQVPMECLSSKTLSARITMSAPLIYPSRSSLIQTTPYSIPTHQDVLRIPIKVAEKKVENMTRDVGVQSTPAELTSPPLEQDSIKCSAKKSDSPKLKYETEVEAKKAYKDEEETKRKGKGDVEGEGEEKGKKGIQGGCLSLSFRSLWRQREKHKSKKQVCSSLFTISMYAKQNLKAS